MKGSILIVERIVIEALEKRGLFLKELEEQTGLKEALLKAVCRKLLDQEILTYDKGFYELNWQQREKWLPLLTCREGTKAEIKELFSSLVNVRFERHPGATLRMKKIWLEPEEQEVLNIKLREIDLFLENIQKKRTTRPVKEVTKGKQVLFYGHSPYESLVDSLLQVG